MSFERARPGDTESKKSKTKGAVVLRLALVFLVVAAVTAIFGFGNIAAGATTIAIILFAVFVVLFIVSLLAGLTRRRR